MAQLPKVTLLPFLFLLVSCIHLEQHKKLLALSRYPTPRWVHEKKIVKTPSELKVIVIKNYVRNLSLGLRQVQDSGALKVKNILLQQRKNIFCHKAKNKKKCYHDVKVYIRKINSKSLSYSNIYWESVKEYVFNNNRHYYKIWLQCHLWLDRPEELQ